MRNWKNMLAALLALVMLLALGSGIAMAEAETGSGTIDDFLGTWELDCIAIIQDGDVVGDLFVDDMENPPQLTFAIERDRVLFLAEDETITFVSPEIKVNEKNGKEYLSMVDESGSRLNLNRTDSFNDMPHIYWFNNEYMYYFKRTGDAAETAEEAQPAEEAQSTGKTELHYTPGQDLLIGELGGVKIWLKGEPNSDFGEYVEPWDAYMWHTLVIENNSDSEVLVTESGAVDGFELILGTRNPGYAAHATEENTIALHHDEFEGDDAAWHSAVDSPKTLELELELTAVSGRYEKADYTSDYETKTPIGKMGPVVIYFDGEAATDSADSDAAEADAEKAEPADPGKVHKDKATVKAVQQALNDAGYECGKPDGSAGKKTKAAITAYQTDKGLTVTGTVTDELLRSLGLQ